MQGIYKITNLITNLCYIGKSNNIDRRWKDHKRLAFTEGHKEYNKALYCSMRKYGLDNFSFEIIEELEDYSLSDEKEKYWIKYYNCCVLENRKGGYNLTHGGEEYKSDENPWAKLSITQVKEIIDKLINTKISIQDLAKEYKVHYNCISDINCCKT